MHKHRTKRSASGSSKFANANKELPAATRTAVYELLSSIDGGTDFAVSYLQQEYLAKYCDDSLVLPAERKLNAIVKWKECEKANYATNLRWKSRDNEQLMWDFESIEDHMLQSVHLACKARKKRWDSKAQRTTFGQFLRFARRIIRDTLGPLHDEVVLGGFSGGASTSRSRTSSSPAQKFTGKVDLTEEVWKFLDIVYREAPLLREVGAWNQGFTEVPGSVLFTVPKKTDIDRCACKEPDINMYLQRGVGNHIRRRLRARGIDLNDQSINRQLARAGSVDYSVATLDLSSASDLIATEVVRALLPRDWFEYLDDIRSKYVEIEGVYHRMEMFSSMGNGFTFELESLIFWALMRTTMYFWNISGVVSVYGDDLIIPTSGYFPALATLSQFGFKVNPEKSFAEGVFRESCGGHYYDGEDVTPFYLKREATHLTDLIRVCNQLRQWAFREPTRQFQHPTLFRVWNKLALEVPFELWGGYDYAVDTRLVSPPVSERPKQLRRVGIRKHEPDIGGYLHWHNSNWRRTMVGDSPAIEPVNTTNICRMVRVRSGAPVCPDWFQEELRFC